MAQAVNRWSLIAETRVHSYRLVRVGFVVYRVALRRVFRFLRCQNHSAGAPRLAHSFITEDLT
jgi:hypothetical protein